jgi:hypothetical protein
LIFFYFFLSVFYVSSQEDILEYIFLGHTYQWYVPGYKADLRLHDINLSQYDGVWLGGDVCSESLLEYRILEYIDSLFNLKHPNSHWAMGNHDARNGNWIWLEELTGEKTYNTSHYKGISYIVLNTTLTPYDCEQLDDQFRMITNVCDTIKNSSHLILLMHHGIWHSVPGLPPSPYSYAQSNLIHFKFNCFSNESSFLNVVYPELVKVKNRGVDVICILGDMGSRKIDLISDDGIHFLGTGLHKSYYKDLEERKNAASDYVLIFKHVPKTRKLSWEFIDLDILSGYEY